MYLWLLGALGRQLQPITANYNQLPTNYHEKPWPITHQLHAMLQEIWPITIQLYELRKLPLLRINPRFSLKIFNLILWLLQTISSIRSIYVISNCSKSRYLLQNLHHLYKSSHKSQLNLHTRVKVKPHPNVPSNTLVCFKIHSKTNQLLQFEFDFRFFWPD